MSHTYILGLGSPHGWDQLGWLAIDRLSDEFDDRPEFTLARLAQPIDLFSLPIENRDHLILVDAILADGTTGDIRWLQSDKLPCARTHFSSHGVDLKSTIDLLQACGFPTAQIEILGVIVPVTDGNELDLSANMQPLVEALARVLMARFDATGAETCSQHIPR